MMMTWDDTMCFLASETVPFFATFQQFSTDIQYEAIGQNITKSSMCRHEQVDSSLKKLYKPPHPILAEPHESLWAHNSLLLWF